LYGHLNLTFWEVLLEWCFDGGGILLPGRTSCTVAFVFLLSQLDCFSKL